MIVTAIDRPYLPGLKALHNSIKRNSPGIPVACIVYGDDDLADQVASRGIWVLHNPSMDVRLPTTDRYPVGNPAMYCRLMLPKWFETDTVWLDADQVVLQPLDPLFDMKYDEPCACVPSTQVKDHVIGSNDCADALYAGLIHMNRAVWNQERVTERCFELMNSSALTFKYVVQSVLGAVLSGRFMHLPPMWQRFGNRHHEAIPADAKVVHWHGHSRNPWMCTMANQSLWEQYACE